MFQCQNESKQTLFEQKVSIKCGNYLDKNLEGLVQQIPT